jgi:hypothetical protein
VDINFQTVFGGLSTAYKLTRFAYRVYLRRPFLKVYRPLKRFYGRYYAWKHRPPTAEHSREARAHLQIILKAIDDAQAQYKGGTAQNVSATLTKLTDAAYHLKKAIKLDPNVTVTTETENGLPFTASVDYLAAEILYRESWAHRELYLKAHDRSKQFRNDHWRKAHRAALKSIEYQPNVVPFLQQLARCQADSIFRLFKARSTLKKARALDPDNPKTIILQHELFRLW